MPGKKPGRAFEEAVYGFVKRLGDPHARPFFDHRVPDRDTGTMRQVDAWVEGRIMRHFPFAALISCKDWKAPLDIDDIGALCDQIRSTRANMGIVYSRSGFTKPAIEKATQNRISCCRLYANEPADTPDLILLTYYCCVPELSVDFAGSLPGAPEPSWSDFLDEVIQDPSDGSTSTGAQALASLFVELEERGRDAADGADSFPRSMKAVATFTSDETGDTFMLTALCRWRCFRGQLRATLVDGSYCVNDSHFVGRQFGPVIDTQAATPGEGWEEVDPLVEQLAGSRCMVLLLRGEAAKVEQDIQILRTKALPMHPPRTRTT